MSLGRPHLRHAARVPHTPSPRRSCLVLRLHVGFEVRAVGTEFHSGHHLPSPGRGRRHRATHGHTLGERLRRARPTVISRSATAVGAQSPKPDKGHESERQTEPKPVSCTCAGEQDLPTRRRKFFGEVDSPCVSLPTDKTPEQHQASLALRQLFRLKISQYLGPQARSPRAASSLGGRGAGSDSSRAVAEDVPSIGARQPPTEVVLYGGTVSGWSQPLAGDAVHPLMCERQMNGNVGRGDRWDLL